MKVYANGIDIHCRLDGPPGAPVVMLSHSLATHLQMWQAQSALAERYRVLSYDTRGHGASGAPDTRYTLEMLADDARALLDALEIERVHWVGISMGGMVGQTLALMYPRRVASLSLADTMSEFPREAAGAWQERIALAQEQGMRALVEPTIERWFSPAFAAAHPGTVDPIRRMIEATPLTGYLACSRAIMELDAASRLAEIEVPTLVLVGEHDASTPLACSQQIQERIAGAQLEVLAGARHLSNIEAAEPFNAALGAFLARAAAH